jgi:radical SAM protein with 4Fe4S-binding SPASM domain
MIINKFKKLIKYTISNPQVGFNLVGIELARILKWKIVPFLPLMIDVEPNNTCNFKCVHCQVTYSNKKSNYLNRETFRQVLAQIPNLIKVKLQGMGEPLLNKELIPMLQVGEERGIQMHFYTNGSINDKSKTEQLTQLKNTHITYSIDGATAKTFEKVRSGSYFNQIIKNIQLLISQRKLQGNLLVSAWTVLTQDNIHELPQIIQLAKNLNLDYITVQPHLTSWGKKQMLNKVNKIQVLAESDVFATKMAEAKVVAATEGIDLIINKNNRFCREKPCSWAWNSSYIAANGDVVPCCVIADSDVVKMGNVFEQDFKKIWNSPAYQKLREQISNHDLPDYCKHCYVDP